MSKSFDRVYWLYLKLLLIHLGFSLLTVKWIMGFVSSNSFSVLINGFASSFFRSSRGLQRGFPLSSYLFLLVAKGHNRVIHEAKRLRLLQGI
jgi:hypothetical protein